MTDESTDSPGFSKQLSILFKGLFRENKKFYLVYLNFFIFISLVYIFIGPSLYKSLDSVGKRGVVDQIGATYFWGIWFMFYPLVKRLNRVNGVFKDQKMFIIIIFSFKVFLIIVMESLNVFPGYNNFKTDYYYGKRYVLGLDSGFYYPPACSLYFAFMYVINPTMNTLLYRLVTQCWEGGIFLYIYKIMSLKRLKVGGLRSSALFYMAFSVTSFYTSVIHAKFDYFGIFLSMVGLYYLLKQKWFVGTFFLTFVGFFKIYTFFWLLGIFLVLLKMRKWNLFKKFLISTAISGIAQLGVYTLIEGPVFIESILNFGWHFTVWEELYNLNWSYYLKYTGIPGINFIPPVLLISAIIFYVMKYEKTASVQMIINITAIMLVFYPSVNFHYVTWIIPLLSLTYTGYRDGRFWRASLFYKGIHMGIDMHSFSWFLFFGFPVTTIIYTFPYTTLMLVIRLLTMIPFVIGLYYYINVKNATVLPFFDTVDEIGHQGRDKNEAMQMDTGS
ncbi:MAG: hypothetical protein ACTSU9_03075 [Promethearchaeota archaeon]